MSRTRTIFAVAATAAALSTAACGSSSSKTAAIAGANSSPAGGNATAACKTLTAWLNGSARHPLSQDPAMAKIVALGKDTKFGNDFNAWQNDLDSDSSSSLDQTLADADQVSADCAAAGVPDLFPGSSSAATAPAEQQTDPNGQQCDSLDDQGYCPGDDPAPPEPAMTKQTDTVVFKVSGTGEPSIQYGTDSSSNNPSGGAGPLGDGHYLPWQASMPYDPGALYYAVTAQLEGSGSIHDSVTEVVTTWCSGSKPKTESFLLASGNASGGYAIARAEYAGGDTGNATQAESDAGC